MDSSFKKEDILKAIEQAEANMSFEDINIKKIKNKEKKLRKDIKHGQDKRRD